MREKMFNVVDYGVISDNQEVQTKRFQQCIDACRDSGGGTILVPAGCYLIGSIRLYSNMKLYLKAGTILQGSTSLKDYQTFDCEPDIGYLHDQYFIKKWHLPAYYFHAMIAAYDASNIKIEAEPGSIIDGQNVFDINGEESFRGPMGMVFSRVKGLQLSGYTFKNSSNWSHVIAKCQSVVITDVSIFAGHDGFNLHHSSDIQIEDCWLKTGDDCLAGYDVSHLTVQDCWLNTACNSMRIGGKDLQFKHCSFIGPGRNPHRSEDTLYTHACFKYYSVEKKCLTLLKNFGEQINIKDSIISGIRNLLTYHNGDREIMQNGPVLRELTFSNTTIDEITTCSDCFGNGAVLNLSFKDCRITPPNDDVFLRLDNFVNLSFSNVTFSEPITVMRNDEEYIFEGYVSSAKIAAQKEV